jgi:hypothetical protein
MAQTSEQQWLGPPSAAPPTPQWLEVQSSFSVQGPTGMGGKQAPALQAKPVAQSALEAQLVSHRPPVPQAKLPGHGAELAPEPAGAQAPSPLQVFWVSVEPVHEAGQVMASFG